MARADMPASTAQWLQAHRYALLFWTLLATVSLGPLLEALHVGDDLLEALLFACLFGAVFPISFSPRQVVLVLLILAVQWLRWLARGPSNEFVPVAGALLWGGIGTLCALRAIRFSLSSARVDQEHFYAALSGYLLLGIGGGVVIAALSSVLPGSMLLAGQPVQAGLNFGDAIYFSFVTLATLGYGDITPVDPILRGVAVLECIVGQLYLALLIARLVGLRSTAPAE